MPYAIFAFCFVLEKTIFSGNSYPADLFSLTTLQTLADNSVYYLQQLGAFLDWDHNLGERLQLGLGALCLFSFTFPIRDQLPVRIYVIAYLFLLIVYPFQQGIRFLYPVLPYVFLFIFLRMKEISAWLKDSFEINVQAVPLVFWFWVGTLSLMSSSSLAANNLLHHRAVVGPFDSLSSAMFDFIRNETPPDSIVVFFKPRVMHLLAERDSFNTVQCEKLLNGDYMVIKLLHAAWVEDYQISPADFIKCSSLAKLHKIYGNEGYTVYEIN